MIKVRRSRIWGGEILRKSVSPSDLGSLPVPDFATCWVLLILYSRDASIAPSGSGQPRLRCKDRKVR
jgi:hypothetical protein